MALLTLGKDIMTIKSVKGLIKPDFQKRGGFGGGLKKIPYVQLTKVIDASNARRIISLRRIVAEKKPTTPKSIWVRFTV